MRKRIVLPVASILLCRSVVAFLPSVPRGTLSPSDRKQQQQIAPMSTNELTTAPTVEDIATQDVQYAPLAQLKSTIRRYDSKELSRNLIGVGAATAVGAAFWNFDPVFCHVGATAFREFVTRAPVEVWKTYETALSTSPLTTKAATSGFVYALGDIVSQRTEGVATNELDATRITRSLMAGLIGHGPLSHFWYEFSEGLFTNTLQLTEWWSFVPKVMLDQTLWGPIWNNTYILLLGLFRADSVANIWGDMKKSTIPLIVNGLKLWVPVHCITYGLIPVEHRLLWVDMIEIVWVTILASQAAAASSDRGSERTTL